LVRRLVGRKHDEHIKTLATELLECLEGARTNVEPFDLLQAIVTEIAPLESSDFPPSERGEFVKSRAFLQRWAKLTSWPGDKAHLIGRLKALSWVLDTYGLDARDSRQFNWLKDVDLKTIVERDYRELRIILMPSGAWKSTVIMAGSILEAILVDLVTKNSTRLTTAEASALVPTYKSGTKKPHDDWTLADFIDIAADIKLLPESRAKTIDQVVRDYRNFVHPRKEVRSAHPCGEAEAFLAKGGLDGICDHFDRNPP
jgi:hypothetical protein